MKTIFIPILAICLSATAAADEKNRETSHTLELSRGLKGGGGGGGGRGGGGSSGSFRGSSSNGNNDGNFASMTTVLIGVGMSVLAGIMICVKYLKCKKDDEATDQSKSVQTNTSSSTTNLTFDQRLEALRKEHQDTPTGFAKTAPKNGTYKYDYIENTDKKSGVADLTFTDDALTCRYKISGTTKDADGVFTILEGSMTYDGSHMYWKEFQSGLSVLNKGRMNVETSTMVSGEWWADNQRKGRFVSFVLDESFCIGSNDETTTIATDNDNV